MDTLDIGIIAPPWVSVPPQGYGGTEAVIDTLARALDRAGHRVTLFTTGDATCPVTRRSYWAEPVTPMGDIVAETAHVLAAYDALAGCDVIHDHTLIGPLLPARRGSPRVVTTNHAPFTPPMRSLYRAASANVSIVAISHAQRACAPEIPVARVIHHGIDVDDNAFGDGDAGYVLFLGRMCEDKGPDRAIEAAKRAGMRIVIAAKMREPAEIAYFESAVRPLLGPDAEFAGEVGGDDKAKLLAGAVALVNPISWPEPFGMVMIEALAAGTPVVSFRGGAAPEIVRDGVTGYLCDSVEDLAAAIVRAPGLDRAACRDSVRESFSADRMMAEHVSLYASLLSRDAAPVPHRASFAHARHVRVART